MPWAILGKDNGQMTTNTTTAPRIYVACLASYNSGRLHGEWIDCGAEDVGEAISAMLKASPAPDAEEWAIHDHEGWHGLDPADIPMDELGEWAEAIEEHGEALPIYCAHVGMPYRQSVAECVEAFEEAYAGEWRDQVEFGAHLIEDLDVLDEDSMVARYFDYEAFARDLFLGDYFSERAEGGNIHVFQSL